jgi:hypothetical protein
LDLAGAKSKPPVSWKQTEFSLKQFAKRMVQGNYSMFNKWKKGEVAWFVKKKHRPIIQEQNQLIQLTYGPLHWEIEVADFLETFKTWLTLNNFNNAEWIRRQWVQMFLKTVQAKFGRQRKRKGEATSDWRWIWDSTLATRQQVTTQSCQIQCSSL